MTRDELIGKVARAISWDNETCGGICPDPSRYYSDVNVAIDTIFNALKEPTNEMKKGFHRCYLELDNPQDTDLWQAMINASPLAKEE